MVLLREWLRHAMGSWKRPIGVPAGGPLESEWKSAPRVPRTPRFVTALLLLASLGILLTPQVREATRSVADGWHAFASGRYSPPSIAHVARLRKEAARSQDPQVFALIALLSDDPSERAESAEKAIRLDPSLTWIYFEMQSGAHFNEHASLEWSRRLQEWDPQNAVNWLSTGDAICDEFWSKWISEGHAYDQEKVQLELEKNPEWTAAMDRALDAPKYDSYVGRVFELYRTVAHRYGLREPAVALDLLERAGIPNLQNLNMYGDAVFHRAQAAERAGDRKEAARLYWRVALFGEQMRGESQTEIERLIGIRLQGDSYQKLEPLLESAGNIDEASLLGRELQTMNASRGHFNDPGMSGIWLGNSWSSMVLQLLTALILALAAAISFGMCFLFFSKDAKTELRVWGASLSCLAVDYGPVLLILGLAALFAAYHPISRTYDLYLSAPYGVSDFSRLIESLAIPYNLGEVLPQQAAFQFWVALTGMLSAVATYMLFRGTLRRHSA